MIGRRCRVAFISPLFVARDRPIFKPYFFGALDHALSPTSVVPRQNGWQSDVSV